MQSLLVGCSASGELRRAALDERGEAFSDVLGAEVQLAGVELEPQRAVDRERVLLVDDLLHPGDTNRAAGGDLLGELLRRGLEGVIGGDDVDQAPGFELGGGARLTAEEQQLGAGRTWARSSTTP